MINLTREEAQQMLDTMQHAKVFVTSREKIKQPEGGDLYDAAIETLRARLSAPEPEQTRSEKMREAGITRRPKGWSKEDEPEPVAWHEPGSYSNVTVYKKWAEENKWFPLYKERT